MQMQWRKMSTAPKDDHTQVLLTDGVYVYIGYWNGHSWDDGDYRDDLGDMVAWMPLPPITRTVKMRAKHGD